MLHVSWRVVSHFYVYETRKVAKRCLGTLLWDSKVVITVDVYKTRHLIIEVDRRGMLYLNIKYCCKFVNKKVKDAGWLEIMFEIHTTVQKGAFTKSVWESVCVQFTVLLLGALHKLNSVSYFYGLTRIQEFISITMI